MNQAPVVRDVCLVGGGHSHCLLLRKWAMQPLPGVRLSLVSTSVQTPYSGMLPGLIAGHYAYDDIHIDLLRLCTWANVRFIEDSITGIDLDAKQVRFDDRPPLAFDVLSLDTGSTPDLSVPGSAEHVTPVKPVSHFHDRWRLLEQRVGEQEDAELSIGVVGAGAGGFELATAMQHRLQKTGARVHWFLRSSDSISGRPARVSQLAQAAAEGAGIVIERNFDVLKVEAGKLFAKDGRCAQLDEILWCTGATGPAWPNEAGLATDSRGFVATNESLQSTSHDFVFATGDIGTQVLNPSAKAGVFAVRQAPVLLDNIRRYIGGQPLRAYRAQRDFLSLMATGSKHAIASRGPVVVQGDWVWRWKDHIDQTFMDQFRNLPKRRMNASLAVLPNALRDQNDADQVAMRCRGCGAKVGEGVLQGVLDDMQITNASELHALSPAADTAIVDLPSRRLVQSVDQINAIIDDPYILGRIAALHALSDVVTVDATAHSAQVLVTLPESSEALAERDLRLVMAGVVRELNAHGCALIGGHTSQGPDMSIGLVVNATMTVAEPITDELRANTFNKDLSSDGDVFILTKAIGVGTLFAALRQHHAHGADVVAAQQSMLLDNATAAHILRAHGSSAMTDVTGFGLLGHLQRLLNSMQGATLGLDQVPIFNGALTLSEQGVRSSLWTQNSSVLATMNIDNTCDEARLALLVDPQTSGGLLAVVPKANYALCLAELLAAGYDDASVIGTLDSGGCISINPALELP